MDEATTCRVCGWDLDEEGWVDGSPLYLICECCGAETGVDDSSLEQVRAYRAAWAARGYPWWERPEAPAGWSFTEEQEARIPVVYR